MGYSDGCDMGILLDTETQDSTATESLWSITLRCLWESVQDRCMWSLDRRLRNDTVYEDRCTLIVVVRIPLRMTYTLLLGALRIMLQCIRSRPENVAPGIWRRCSHRILQLCLEVLRSHQEKYDLVMIILIRE
jgi:hypothetical protein